MLENYFGGVIPTTNYLLPKWLNALFFLLCDTKLSNFHEIQTSLMNFAVLNDIYTHLYVIITYTNYKVNKV